LQAGVVAQAGGDIGPVGAGQCGQGLFALGMGFFGGIAIAPSRRRAGVRGCR